MCRTRDGFSRIDFTLKKNTRPPRARTVSTGPRYFHVSVRSPSTNIGDHRGKPRQRRIERKATRSGERERGEGEGERWILLVLYWILNGHPPFSRSNHALVRRLIRAKRVLKNWSIGAAYPHAYFFTSRTFIYVRLLRLCQYWNRRDV